MEITEERAIAKIIFWQQLSTILLTLFLLLFWGFITKDVILGLKYGYFSDIDIQSLYFGVLCSLGTYATYLLYQSLNFLKAYKREEEKLDLELAFKNQRHFWMTLLLILAFLIVGGIGYFISFLVKQ